MTDTNSIRPAHYAVNGTYEVDKCLAAWARKKDGATEITDLEKAIWNLQRRVEQLRRGEG